MPTRLWILLCCGAAVMALSMGLRQSLGLFLAPVSIDLGLGRGTFALGLGLMNLVWGFSAPFAGLLADRHGPGKVAALGGLLYAAGLLCLTASGSGGQLLLGGVLIGLGLGGAGFTVVLGAAGRAAPENKRSLALGIVSVGGSVGQFLALPYAHGLIGGLGWQLSLLLLASTAALIVPLAAGLAGSRGAQNADSEQTAAEALDEAGRSRSFILLTAGFFVCGFHLAFVAVHLPAYLQDLGQAPWVATAALTLVGLSNIVGTYGCGLLGLRYSKKNLLSLLYLARALVFLVFLLLPVTPVSVLIFGAVIGLLWLGTVPLTSALVAQFFGTRYLSMLFGIVFLGHQLGGFSGAWLAGYLYDLLGTYDPMWWLSVALGLGSAALHWPIVERPVARQQRRAAGSPA